ncbi:MAG: hypothetical protein KGY46_09815 [Anaerolineales bacterium]|nr:hypothetical protein [Anaerolineales bacterium]
MDTHLYLSLIPEALIASMLPPEDFGVYYAVGSAKKAQGQAIFFELDPDYRHEYFRIEEGLSRCVPHDDGRPKASVYISIYRVLEHVSLDALKKLYLVTRDGRVLGLDPRDEWPEEGKGMHLYQEIVPVHPLVASTLGPKAFFDLIVKDTASLFSLPAICFVELRLGELAEDPEGGDVGNLPYSNMAHLRQCLVDLRTKRVHTKMVNRIQPATFPYRMISSGIFVGNGDQFKFFAMPADKQLRKEHYRWWRSAQE